MLSSLLRIVAVAPLEVVGNRNHFRCQRRLRTLIMPSDELCRRLAVLATRTCRCESGCRSTWTSYRHKDLGALCELGKPIGDDGRGLRGCCCVQSMSAECRVALQGAEYDCRVLPVVPGARMRGSGKGSKATAQSKQASGRSAAPHESRSTTSRATAARRGPGVRARATLPTRNVRGTPPRHCPPVQWPPTLRLTTAATRSSPQGTVAA